jgi:hypothetical protein
MQPEDLFRSRTVLYVAVAHSWHPLDALSPSTTEYLPAPQPWQSALEVRAVSGWYVPALHRLQ